MSYNQTMTDVAYSCLSKRKREIEFAKLWAEVSKTMKIPEEKLKRKLKELSDQGYGAVRTGYSSLIICITSVPELEEKK